MKRLVVFALVTVMNLVGCFSVKAQTYLYATTDNLIVRDRPDSNYSVFLLLNRGCKVKLEEYDNDYKKDKFVKNRFYEVSFVYKDTQARSHKTTGWVVKQFLSVHQLKGLVNDSSFTDVNLLPYIGANEKSPNRNNRFLYPYPKYKGGEKNLKKEEMRKYFAGPRGGCYYFSAKGKKVYVDKKFCRQKK